MSEPLDRAICPLCGQPNACALAQARGASVTECWCSKARFDAGLLARVPAAAQGRACICRRCQLAQAPVPVPD